MEQRKSSAIYALASVALLQAALTLLGGCSAKKPTEPAKLHNPYYVCTINAPQLRHEMERTQRLKVVNVLDKKTFENCSIAGSIHVPLSTLEKVAGQWKKHQRIVVYCASYDCPTSKHAFNILHRMGFRNIYAYEGGTKEWREKGYPITGPCRSTYLKN